MTTVLGIDPSLTRTAVAVIQPGLITLRDFPTKGTKTDTLLDRAKRLNWITGTVLELIRDVAPIDLAVIEGPSFAQRSQGGTHDRAGLWWGLVREMTTGCLDIVAEVPPTCRAMYATGKGNAGKDEVMLATARRYAQAAEVANNDQADALVLAAMGARHLGTPIEESLPASHLRALDKVAWPADVPAGAGAQGVAS